jgi:hypothetical protein
LSLAPTGGIRAARTERPTCRRAGIRREGQAECRLAAKEETSLMNAGSAAVAQDLNGETGAWRGRVEEGEVVEATAGIVPARARANPREVAARVDDLYAYALHI